MSYSERLRLAMERKTLSQSELARRVGVKPQSIQYLLDPKKGATGSRFTAAIAAALDVDPHWLETGQSGTASEAGDRGRAEVGLQLEGVLISVGDLSQFDTDAMQSTPAVQIRTDAGRIITLAGLTRDEAAAAARWFGDRMGIQATHRGDTIAEPNAT